MTDSGSRGAGAGADAAETADGARAGGLPIPLAELVAMVALLTGLNALAINIMLPALGDIGDAFNVASANDRQLVVVVYLFSMGVGQIAYGPLSDRFGRRPVLLTTLSGYIIGSALCVIATDFSLLLVARAFQGLATAAARVVSVAVVRDLSSGRRMAEIMSLAATIFMLVPVAGPAIGELVLFVAPWRGAFVALLLYGVVMLVWAALRLPESHPRAARSPLRPSRIASAYLSVVRTPVTLGYTLASAAMFGGFFGFLSSSEQIFIGTFGLGQWFAAAYAGIALSMTAASLLNARLVGRYGMRRLSHIALLGVATVNVVHVVVAVVFGESFWVFFALMAATMFAMGLVISNFNAIALEPLGRIAGTASAAFGFTTTTLSALVGGVIGRLYDGSATPVVLGLAGSALAGVAIVLATERGVLFRATPPPARPEGDAKLH